MHNAPTYENFVEHLKVAALKTASTITVNRSIAEGILKNNNPKNRPLSPSHIEKLRSQMEKKLWRINNGECLKFYRSPDNNIELYDGQHRLSAVSKFPEEFNVNLDIFITDDPDVIDTVDIGKPRTLKDITNINLKKKGYNQEFSTKISAVGKSLLYAEKAYKTLRKFSHSEFPPYEIYQFCENNLDEIAEAVAFIRDPDFESFLATEMNYVAIGVAYILLKRKYGKEYSKSFLRLFMTLIDQEDKVLPTDDLFNQARVKWVKIYKHRCTYNKRGDKWIKANGKVTQERTLGYILTLSNAYIKERKQPIGEKFYEGDIKGISPLPILVEQL